ncbi:hypothetical protein K456DRAFT_1718831 [Colletotrichum gloeosporioides 23]|nr:hypothetical protein K456DRAFT_1718831 [Colletotrichum gloeosporioides 23]KAJ0287115.1 hypothetical protein COL940_002657 [Colletotrichum noveboracense]KAJ0292457.1 hypothetical protein CBS470a_002763 [Colletotrichum nupharicola]
MGRNVSYLNEDEIDIRRRYVSEIQLILLTDESIWVLSEAEQAVFQQARFWALLWTTELRRLESIHATLSRADNSNEYLSSTRLATAIELKSAVLNAHAYVGYATCRADQVGDKPENIARNESAAEKAGDRDDNKCVATGCHQSQIYHFAAVFGISRKSAMRWLLFCMRVFIGPQAYRDLEVKLIGSGTIIDTPSNMVTLTHKLHKYMDDAIFGLEPVSYISRRKPELNAPSGESNGQEMNTGPATGDSRTQGHAELQTDDASLKIPDPDHRSGTSAGLRTVDVNLVASGESPNRWSRRAMECNLERKADAEAEADRIQAREEEKRPEEMRQHGLEIRCHWLPRTNLRCPLDKVEDFGADPREMMEEWSAENYEFRYESGQPLNSGTIITIWADKKADLPDVGIMKFIFQALCFHRLSGGADTRIYRPWTHYETEYPGHTYASDPRREAERRILKILAEDDKAGGVHNADRNRETEKEILRALAELEISPAEASSNQVVDGGLDRRRTRGEYTCCCHR